MSDAAVQERAFKQDWAVPGSRHDRLIKLAKIGLPSAVVPVALHDGQPIGVQLIAGRYREDLALDAAAAIEKRAGILVPRLWEKMG